MSVETEAQTEAYVTPEEYLAREREAERKHEYLDGEVTLMSGASRWHVLIVTNIVRELSTQLKESPCLVFSTDLRVRTGEAGLYTYPDVAVVCDEPRYLDDHFDTLLNPALLVEVLSTSTRDYDGREFDRGEKFACYRTLDALEEYVLIDQEAPHVEHFARQEEGRWLLSETEDLGDTVELPSVGARLALSEIYHKVEFE